MINNSKANSCWALQHKDEQANLALPHVFFVPCQACWIAGLLRRCSLQSRRARFRLKHFCHLHFHAGYIWVHVRFALWMFCVHNATYAAIPSFCFAKSNFAHPLHAPLFGRTRWQNSGVTRYLMPWRLVRNRIELMSRDKTGDTLARPRRVFAPPKDFEQRGLLDRDQVLGLSATNANVATGNMPWSNIWDSKMMVSLA